MYNFRERTTPSIRLQEDLARSIFLREKALRISFQGGLKHLIRSQGGRCWASHFRRARRMLIPFRETRLYFQKRESDHLKEALTRFTLSNSLRFLFRFGKAPRNPFREWAGPLLPRPCYRISHLTLAKRSAFHALCIIRTSHCILFISFHDFLKKKRGAFHWWFHINSADLLEFKE